MRTDEMQFSLNRTRSLLAAIAQLWRAAASHYGIPILLNRHGDVFGAADIPRLHPSVGHCSAAVCAARHVKRLGEDERTAARKFWRQLPNGPRL